MAPHVSGPDDACCIKAAAATGGVKLAFATTGGVDLLSSAPAQAPSLAQTPLRTATPSGYRLSIP